MSDNKATSKNANIPRLNKGNYYAWSRRVKSELVEKNGWIAIEPGYGNVNPSDYNEVQSRANRKALSFMLKYVSDDYIEDIGELEKAEEAWNKL